MMKRLKINKTEFLFILFSFIIFLSLAIIIPYNKAPDEYVRYLIPQYIYNHMALPLGNDLEVMIPNWGFSYAFQPIFSYIISGVFMKITSIFTTAEVSLVLSARFASVLFSTLTVYFTVKIANSLFDNMNKWVFISLVATFPMFAFVSAYINTDAMAITSTSILIYAWILGLKENWSKYSLIMLTVGLCTCALSYQNAYGYIVVTCILFISEFVKKLYRKNDLVSFLKKGFLVGIITFFIGGSTYIRNYFIYDGDFMGTTVQTEMAEQYAIEKLKPSNKEVLIKDGVSLTTMFYNWEWVDTTYKSFIGVFDYMKLPMPQLYYNFYGIIFVGGLLGIILSIKKWFKTFTYEMGLFDILMMISAVSCIFLNIFQSYVRDFQPQGRYSLPMLIPLMYFVTKGLIKISGIIKDKYFNITRILFLSTLMISILSIVSYVFVNSYL